MLIAEQFHHICICEGFHLRDFLKSYFFLNSMWGNYLLSYCKFDVHRNFRSSFWLSREIRNWSHTMLLWIKYSCFREQSRLEEFCIGSQSFLFHLYLISALHCAMHSNMTLLDSRVNTLALVSIYSAFLVAINNQKRDVHYLTNAFYWFLQACLAFFKYRSMDCGKSYYTQG